MIFHDPPRPTLRPPTTPCPKSGGRDPNPPGLTPLYLKTLECFSAYTPLIIALIKDEKGSVYRWVKCCVHVVIGKRIFCLSASPVSTIVVTVVSSSGIVVNVGVRILERRPELHAT